VAREAFYRRIEQASRFSRVASDRGRIHYYGLSSIRSRQIHRMQWRRRSLACATLREFRCVTGNRPTHFAVLQCPMNLYEAGALVTPKPGWNSRSGVGRSRNEKRSRCLFNRRSMPCDKNERRASIGGFSRSKANPVDFDQTMPDGRALEEEYRKPLPRPFNLVVKAWPQLTSSPGPLS